MPLPLQHAHDYDDEPIKHPADNLYTYTLYAQIPPPVVEPGRHLRLPQWMSPTSQPQNELSVRPDSLVRLKTMTAIPAIHMAGLCRGFIRRRIPRTPVNKPRNPNVDNRPMTFFLDCPGFDGHATSEPVTNNQEMVDWTMKVLETVGTVMALVFPCARDLKFSRAADDEMQDPAVDDHIYVPLYYKRKESRTVRVNESLVKLVVAQLAPWSLLDRDTEDFTNISEFPSCYVGPDGQVHSPDSLDRLQKIWARLWLDCARVNCPFFILTTGETWILGAFCSGRTQAIHFRLSYQRDNIPSLFQCLIFWCASALNVTRSWLIPFTQASCRPDVRAPELCQFEEYEMAVASDQAWLDAHVEHLDVERCQTIKEGDNVWVTYILD